MKLYIDSINIEEIKKFSKLGIFSGVTTNPTFFKREDIGDSTPVLKDISKCFDGELHVSTLGNTAEEIVNSAVELKKEIPNMVAKIPITYEGIIAVRKLNGMGYKTNVHLVFSSSQALLAAKAGSTYVSPQWRLT